MVAPLGAGGAEQRLVVVDRSQDGEGLREEEVLSVVFQPLEAHPPSLSRKEMPRARLERLQGEVRGRVGQGTRGARAALPLRALRGPLAWHPP